MPELMTAAISIRRFEDRRLSITVEYVNKTRKPTGPSFSQAQRSQYRIDITSELREREEAEDIRGPQFLPSVYLMVKWSLDHMMAGADGDLIRFYDAIYNGQTDWYWALSIQSASSYFGY